MKAYRLAFIISFVVLTAYSKPLQVAQAQDGRDTPVGTLTPTNTLTPSITPTPVPTHPGETPTPAGSLDDDLVSCWDMEEDGGPRYDAITNSHLTEYNTVSRLVGQSGYAANFIVGNNENLNLINSADLAGGRDFTLVMVAKLNSYGDLDSPTGGQILVRRYGDYQITYAADTGTWTGLIGATNITYGGHSPDDVWRTVFLWNDYGSQTCMQIDDSTPTCQSVDTAGGTATFYMGGYDGDGSNWGGQVDTGAFWTRLLTADERESLYLAAMSCPYVLSFNATATPDFTPAPSATVTPVPGAYSFELPSSKTLTVRPDISFGDISVVAAVSILLLVIIIGGGTGLIRRWLA